MRPDHGPRPKTSLKHWDCADQGKLRAEIHAKAQALAAETDSSTQPRRWKEPPGPGSLPQATRKSKPRSEALAPKVLGGSTRTHQLSEDKTQIGSFDQKGSRERERGQQASTQLRGSTRGAAQSGRETLHSWADKCRSASGF